jgi:hypothetical protein
MAWTVTLRPLLTRHNTEYDRKRENDGKQNRELMHNQFNSPPGRMEGVVAAESFTQPATLVLGQYHHDHEGGRYNGYNIKYLHYLFGTIALTA